MEIIENDNYPASYIYTFVDDGCYNILDRGSLKRLQHASQTFPYSGTYSFSAPKRGNQIGQETFGVIIVVVTQMGVISPPVGVNAYVVSGIERDVPLQTIFRGCMPFLVALIIASVILVVFPQVSLFLPSLVR